VFRYIQTEDFAFRTRIDLPLYTSGRIRHGIDAAQAQRNSAELQVAIFRSDLKLRVAEEFVAVLRAQRDVEVARSDVRSLESHLRDVEMLFLHDRVPRNDLLAAKVAFSNARQREIQTINRVDVTRAAYNRRLGRPLTARYELAELQPTEIDEDLETLTLRAVSIRPEMASLSAQARTLQQRGEAVRARNRPQIGLHGQYAFRENRFQTPQGIASLGVGLSWDALDGGRRRYESGALLEQATGLLRLREDLESKIRLEVRRAWLEVQEARKRIEVTREAIEYADENLRITRESYSLGSGTNTDVLDAIRRRAETNRNHFHATYDLVLATMRLRRAVWEL
jgi:outer membrane protein TolC